MRNSIDFFLCDSDNHYYEPLDACTRHLDPSLRHRGVQFIERDGRTLCLVGEKISHFIPNPSFEPIAVPGCGDEYFRGQAPLQKSMREIMQLEPQCRPSYRSPEARVDVLDEQGVERVFNFPTFGYGLEESLANDVDAAFGTIQAFNRWLLDDWTFNYKNRIFSAPIVTPCDPVRVVKEVEWLLKQGACIVTMRPAPASCADGRKSLGNKVFDPLWATLAEANVPVAFHIADSGYQRYAADWDDHPEFRPISRGDMTLGKLYYQERPIFDTLAALILHEVFHRHPRLKVASIENGALWLPLLDKKLTKAFNQNGTSMFKEHPRETIRKHIWVSPYAEDDFSEAADIIGEDNIIMGSDWPHAECLARPKDYLELIEDFSDEAIRKIMRENFFEFAPLAAS